MSSRLVPAYVERPAWALYELVENIPDAGMTEEDLEALVDAARDLREGLVRATAITLAPGFVLAQELGL